MAYEEDEPTETERRGWSFNGNLMVFQSGLLRMSSYAWVPTALLGISVLLVNVDCGSMQQVD